MCMVPLLPVTTGMGTTPSKTKCEQATPECATARARMKWPPNPTWREVARRAHRGELSVLRMISECEQPGSGTSPFAPKYEPPAQWHTAWGINAGATYVGAYGMWKGTYGIGAAVTFYDSPPNATPAEETGVAIVVLRRFGQSAWGCG